MEQREGRIIRQGNTNEKVQIYTYVVERTFDSYSYQILENKQRFISQINRGNLTIREAEDIDETTLSIERLERFRRRSRRNAPENFFTRFLSKCIDRRRKR